MTTLKSLPADLIDSLLGDYKKPEDLIGEHGLLKSSPKHWLSALCKWKRRAFGSR